MNDTFFPELFVIPEIEGEGTKLQRKVANSFSVSLYLKKSDLEETPTHKELLIKILDSVHLRFEACDVNDLQQLPFLHSTLNSNTVKYIFIFNDNFYQLHISPVKNRWHVLSGKKVLFTFSLGKLITDIKKKSRLWKALKTEFNL